MIPGDLAVVRRVVTAVVNVVTNRIAEVSDKPFVKSQAAGGREKAFGNAKGHVHALGLAPFGNAITVAKHNTGDRAVGFGGSKGATVVVLFATVLLDKMGSKIRGTARMGWIGRICDGMLE